MRDFTTIALSSLLILSPTHSHLHNKLVVRATPLLLAAPRVDRPGWFLKCREGRHDKPRRARDTREAPDRATPRPLPLAVRPVERLGLVPQVPSRATTTTKSDDTTGSSRILRAANHPPAPVRGQRGSCASVFTTVTSSKRTK